MRSYAAEGAARVVRPHLLQLKSYGRLVDRYTLQRLDVCKVHIRGQNPRPMVRPLLPLLGAPAQKKVVWISGRCSRKPPGENLSLSAS